jgi:tetratricopeptide (TPR) repeat protein
MVMPVKCSKCSRNVPEKALCMYCGNPLGQAPAPAAAAAAAPAARHVMVVGPEVADPIAAIRARVDELRGLPPAVRAVRFEVAKESSKAFLDEGRFVEAIGALDEALAYEPGEAHLWIAKALCLGALRRHAESLPMLERALVLAPRLAEAWFHKADHLEVLGRLDESLAAYDRVISIDPRHAQAFCDRGHVFNRMKRPLDALASFDKAVALEPRLVVAWFNKAGAELTVGRKADAAQSLERCLAVANPAEHGAVIERARGLLAVVRS